MAAWSGCWGFPLSLTGKSGQPLKPRPVKNTGADKLDSFMWRYSFAERRCLIPVTEFAERKGEKARAVLAAALRHRLIGLLCQPIWNS